MTRREKNMNLRIMLFGALTITAAALTVYATGFPELRNAHPDSVQTVHVSDTTAPAIIHTHETGTAARTFETVSAILPPEPVEPRESYNGIYEGDTITGTLTYYDVCLSCCGKTDGITASGIRIQNGVEPETPVVGCNWLPLMTIITIDGVEYIVADRGGDSLNTVGRLDVFNPAGHEDSLQKGIDRDAEIVIVELPGE
ncbi:MAG: hypothetical protein IJ325_07230 [Clostridia bacterium]|nr:hypothetical protein [Clostridia bacterium]